MNKVDISNTDG